MSGNLLRNTMRLVVRLTLKPMLGPSLSIASQRRMLKLLGVATRVPRDVLVTPRILGSAPGETLQPSGPVSQDGVILFLHGGGYCVGSLDSHRPLSATLAKASGLTVFALDYRLAPEHPYPAALNDAVSAYRALLDEGHSRIVLAGDSAGGGLALATALSLRDAGLPAPAALLLISPWGDVGCSAATMVSNAAADPMLSQASLQRLAAAYVGRVPTDHPLCSPLFADLKGPAAGDPASRRARDPAGRHAAPGEGADPGQGAGHAAGLPWPVARLPPAGRHPGRSRRSDRQARGLRQVHPGGRQRDRPSRRLKARQIEFP